MTQVWLGFTFHDLPKGSPQRAELFSVAQDRGGDDPDPGLDPARGAADQPAAALSRRDGKVWERAFAVWTHRFPVLFPPRRAAADRACRSVEGSAEHMCWPAGSKCRRCRSRSWARRTKSFFYTTLALLVLHVAGALKHRSSTAAPRPTGCGHFARPGAQKDKAHNLASLGNDC